MPDTDASNACDCCDLCCKFDPFPETITAILTSPDLSPANGTKTLHGIETDLGQDWRFSGDGIGSLSLTCRHDLPGYQSNLTIAAQCAGNVTFTPDCKSKPFRLEGDYVMLTPPPGMATCADKHVHVVFLGP